MAADDIHWAPIAAAAATLSDSAPPRRRGIVTCASHSASTPSGSPSRSAPRQRVWAPSSRVEPGAAVGDEGGARRRRLPHRGAQRRLGEDRAHARPHRLRRVGVGALGAEDDGAVQQRVGGADDRADVAGVADPVQVEAGRARGVGPAQRPDGDRPRAGAERGGVGQQLRLDLLAAEPGAGGGEDEARLCPGRQPGLEQVLALAGEQALALAVLALAQLAHQLQLLVVRALDHLLGGCLFWSSAVSPGIAAKTGPETKKAGRFHGPPGRVECGCAAQAAAPSRASSTNRRKASLSCTAISASILRLTSISALLRPLISSE